MRIVIAVQGLAAGLAAAAADPIFTSCHARYYNGPLVSNPDTADAFRFYPPFQWTGTIRNASHTFDQEYAPVPGFINLNSAAQSPGYLFSVQPEAYDPSICASICETAKACEAFNIFFERAPLIVNLTTGLPDPVLCPGRSTSPSATLIKCAFFNQPISAVDAINDGQYIGEFEVTFAGSTAFSRWKAPEVYGFEGPVSFGGATIHASSGYIRMETFPATEYNPERCAETCDDLIEYDDEGNVLSQCLFINSYVKYTNGVAGEFACAYYSDIWNHSQATNHGQIDGDGNIVTIALSYGYWLMPEHWASTSLGPSADREDDFVSKL